MQGIEIHDLVLARSGGFTLGPLSLDLRPGSRTALVGPSGCGKTTLLRLIAGLERPDSGTIAIGPDRVTDARRLVVPPSGRRIGFVFQDGALWPHMTAVEHLRFVDRRLSPSAAVELLAQVGLGDLAARRPAELSGGERQRLSLARALAGQPQLLLLDEPLHSVDVHLRDELSLLVRRVAERHGLTLIVVTHDREEALAMADDIVIVKDGLIVERGAALDLLRNPRTAYGAAFLCRAVCLPAHPDGADRVQTDFGTLEKSSSGNGRVDLVLLPGDVVVADRAGPDAPLGRVLQVRPDADGRPIATVELRGMSLPVACDAAVRPGDQLPLRLRGAPRLLPEGRPRADEARDDGAAS